jgi:hypothetical protein
VYKRFWRNLILTIIPILIKESKGNGKLNFSRTTAIGDYLSAELPFIAFLLLCSSDSLSRVSLKT